ncbi:uncharacterized protein LOC124691160 [Lolium rigidum]|uniref:uncharacterized protein LOC124691160 n=1 Tax=Lolium rigidum TaxID=89674 RepID=UPI001F5DB579|nr:uncharacterized protein LOC124691160 [Lolium rigidum]
MLLPISRPTDKFAPLAGLRSLLVPDTVAGRGGGVVTRTILASLLPCGEGEIVRQESGDGESVDDDEEDEGCWVPYGRREPGRRRRLPPPIPSLAARSALRRARTDDRRLVISKVRVMRPDYYVRARRVRGGRLVMRLHEREDDGPLPAPDLLPPPTQVDIATTSDEKVDDAQAAAAPAPLPAAAGCFEDVAKYQYAVGSSPLHQTPLLRMVH